MSDTLTIGEVTTDIVIGRPHNVVLFNDDCHSMDQVEDQIIKAIHCDPGTAQAVMLEAHKTGRAIVFTGGLERCEHVAAVLEEIQLSTKIEQV